MQPGRRWMLWVGFVVGIGVLGLAVGKIAETNDPALAGAAIPAGAECSLTTLRGSYLFNSSGVQIVGSDRVPLVYAGHTMFDGKGAVHDNVLTQSLNGVITRHVSSTGSYTVDPDCTGTLTISGASRDGHFDLYIATDGSEFTFVGTDPGSVSAGWEPRATGRRVAG